MNAKLSHNQLIIADGDENTILPASTVAECHTIIKALVDALETVKDVNKSLTNEGAIVEKYTIKHNEPLWDAATKSVSNRIAGKAKSAMSSTAPLLQSQVLKHYMEGIAAVYSEAGNAMLSADGHVALIDLGKGFLAKSNKIAHDLSLIAEDIEAPLQKAKMIKALNEEKEAIYAKGVKHGTIQEQVKIGSVTPEVLDKARILVNTDKSLERINKKIAISEAKRVANKV